MHTITGTDVFVKDPARPTGGDVALPWSSIIICGLTLTQNQKLFSLMTWPSETFVGGQGCASLSVSESSDPIRQNIEFPVRITNKAPKIAAGSLSSLATKNSIETVKGSHHPRRCWCNESFIYVFLPLYLQYKQWNLCTSEFLKARCVGEDRKSSHQLATDSVWEIFASCWMLKLFTFNFQHRTIADNVQNNGHI